MQAAAQRPLWQTYLLFLAPMVLSNFLQSMSGTVNSIYIGQMLGTQALAAVSGMFPWCSFYRPGDRTWRRRRCVDRSGVGRA